MAMYLLDQYRGTVLSCRYDIPPSLAATESRTQLEEAVKVAVVDTIMRHPMLQTFFHHEMLVQISTSSITYVQAPSRP